MEKNYKTSNKEEKIINRMRIGHTRLTHSYLKSGSDPPECSTCSIQLSIKYILSECFKYQDSAKKFNISHHLHECLGQYWDNKKNHLFFKIH